MSTKFVAPDEVCFGRDSAVMRETTGARALFYPPDDARRLSLRLSEAFGGRLSRNAQGFRSRFSREASADKLSDILLGSLAAPPITLSWLRREE
jgi:hypothetical protein